MSETLSKILYNVTSEAEESSDEHSYGSVLSKAQSYLSEHYSTILAETVLEEQARETVRYLIEQYLISHKEYVTGMSIQELTTRLYRDMAGYSILEEPLADPDVEEIMVNSFDDIEIVEQGERMKTSLRFESAEQCRDITRRLVRLSGDNIDASHPRVDAYITAGVRITAVFPPIIVAGKGAVFNIRKQRLENVTRDQLIQWGTISEEALDFIELCLNYGISVSLAGRTGSGKTTLLSYLLNNLDNRRRIITIEETREILIVNPEDEENHKMKSVVEMCTRFSDDPRLNVDMQDLLKTTLRMKPDVIAMGEMRGSEADAVQEAARTGHTVVSTLHANIGEQVYARIMSMCMMNSCTLPVHVLMNNIINAFPITVFCDQFDDGTRKVTEIVEAYASGDGIAKTKTLFQYEEDAAGSRWVRVEPVSEKLVNRMRHRGADKKKVKRFSTVSPASKGVKD